MVLIFKKTKQLEVQIDNYLDKVLSGAMLFKEGIRFYLNNRIDEFEQRLIDLTDTESQADYLRREIESNLYTHTLIPEYRGDVLGLLESTDRVLNRIAVTLKNFSIEKPEMMNEFNDHFLDLVNAAISAVESLITAIRAYFKDFTAVRDAINKVLFFEKESDKIYERITRNIFEIEMDLSQKIHLRHFVHSIELISDLSEDVCDRLSIATIKRHI